MGALALASDFAATIIAAEVVSTWLLLLSQQSVTCGEQTVWGSVVLDLTLAHTAGQHWKLQSLFLARTAFAPAFQGSLES